MRTFRAIGLSLGEPAARVEPHSQPRPDHHRDDGTTSLPLQLTPRAPIQLHDGRLQLVCRCVPGRSARHQSAHTLTYLMTHKLSRLPQLRPERPIAANSRANTPVHTIRSDLRTNLCENAEYTAQAEARSRPDCSRRWTGSCGYSDVNRPPILTPPTARTSNA